MSTNVEILVTDKGYESVDALTIIDKESYDYCVLYSRCSYHITINKAWFESYN